MLALLIFAAAAFLFDQITKHAAPARWAGPFRGSVLQIREVRHRAHIYQRPRFRALLIVVWCGAVMAAVWLNKSGLFLHNRMAPAGVGCALGGAAGNLLDILRRQHVVDFIDLGWWPVFNLADVAIVGGLLLAFGSMVAHV